MCTYTEQLSVIGLFDISFKAGLPTFGRREIPSTSKWLKRHLATWQTRQSHTDENRVTGRRELGKIEST